MHLDSLTLKRNFMSKKPRRSEKSTALRRDAPSRMLAPIVNFLLASGFDDGSIKKALLAALAAKKKSSRKGVAIYPLEKAAAYTSVITLWSTDPRFLNDDGRPKPLSIKGRNGFSTLVKCISNSLNVEDTISDLKNFGNIKIKKDKKVYLLKEFSMSLRTPRLPSSHNTIS